MTWILIDGSHRWTLARSTNRISNRKKTLHRNVFAQ